MSTHGILLMGLLAVLAAASGCFSLDKAYPEKDYFMLDGRPSLSGAPAGEAPVLMVDDMNVAPPYRGAGFVYRLEDLRYESDFYNEFFVPPDSLFTRAVIEWLDAGRLFAHVGDRSEFGVGRYHLSGGVTELYGDYRDREKPVAVLEMKFLVGDETTGRERILMKKTYGRAIPLAAETAGALAKGWSRAFREIMTELEEDLGGIAWGK